MRETLCILIGGALLTVLISVPLGAISGRRIGSVADKVISFGALIGVCTHPIVTGKLLTQWFGIDLKWLPVGGYCTFVKHGRRRACSRRTSRRAADPSTGRPI